MFPPQFKCSSCTNDIPPKDPRIHCLVCAGHDLCAACVLGERFVHPHLGTHQMQVLKQSGGPDRDPVPGSTTLAYTAPPQPPPRPPQAVPSPKAPSPAHSPPPTPLGRPPPIPPRRPSGVPRPSSSVPPRADNAVLGWQSFFAPDMSPTPTYATLMDDIFTYLDPMNNGNLEPETFSRFLDDMGYLTHENAWKQGLQPTYALSKESMADKSLKTAYDLFSIDHVLLKRIQAPHVDTTGLTDSCKLVLGSAFNPSMLVNPGTAHSTVEGPMPAITRKGFLDIMTVEAVCEPSREWGNYSRLLKKYNLPRYVGWGDLPRSVLPPLPDPRMLARVEAITQVAKQKASNELAAARTHAMIAAQGRQAALDLVSDTRYVYRY